MPTPRKFQSNKAFSYSSLEPRNMLAATVYVDFGEGFSDGGGLTINDTQSRDLGGPELFGAGQTLTTYRQDLRAGFSSDVAESVVETNVEDIVETLRGIFEPFDLDVQVVSSSSLDAVATTLQSTPTQDAYVFVGGQIPEGLSGDFGDAVFDEGNSADNLGFVFTNGLERLIENVFNPDPLPVNISGSNNEAIAAAIARQAGISFGVPTTEFSEVPGRSNVMSRIGTRVGGELNNFAVAIGTDVLRADDFFRGEGWGFVRADLSQTQINGESAGRVNTFELLQTAVGGNTNGKQFFTVPQGSVEIVKTGENTIDLHLNGEVLQGVDITSGVELRLSGVSPQLSLTGAAYDLVVTAFDEFTIDQKIDVVALSRNATVELDAFDDSLIYELSSGIEFNLGDGNDTITFPDDGERFFYRASGEGGDDRYVFRDWAERPEEINGGTGNNILDVSQITEEIDLHVWNVNKDGFTFGADLFNTRYFYRGFNEVVASETFPLDFRLGFVLDVSIRNAQNTFGPAKDDNVVTTIDGDTVSIVDETLGQTLTTSGNVARYWGNQVFLKSTTRDIAVTGNNILISSDTDFTRGNTDGIQHDVIASASEELVVSNMAGAALDIEIGLEAIEGLTGGELQVSAARFVIHGSDTGDDRLLYRGRNSGSEPFQFFGHGGDDNVVIGSRLEDHSGSLNGLFVGDDFLVSGGAGDNYLYINDEASESEYVYEVTDSSITRILEGPFVLAPLDADGITLPLDGLINGDFPQRQDRPFFNSQISRISHDGINVVRLTGNSQRSTYRVAPSDNTVFIVEEIDPTAAGDSLELIGDVPEQRSHIEREGEGTGTWYFGSEEGDKQLVLFNGLEHFAQSQRLAVGSQAGSAPLVSVFDPQTQSHLFDIKPYPDRFTGGVQVETADLTGDGIPDIIVAPGPGRWALIQLYDGRNGTRLGGFHAFPAGNPDPSKNFLGGADIAVGNVTGDSGVELIASTLSGTSHVYTFEQTNVASTDPLEFEFVNGFNAFPDQTRVGVQIATGDFDNDGYDDIVSVPGVGAIPEVAIHRIESTLEATQISRFLGSDPRYRGGFNVATGDFSEDRRADLFLTAIDTGTSSSSFSGQFRGFEGTALLTLGPADVAEVSLAIDVFSQETRGLSLRSRDFNRDGRIDSLDFAIENGGDADEKGVVRRFERGVVIRNGNLTAPASLDSVFVDPLLFGEGLELG